MLKLTTKVKTVTGLANVATFTEMHS